VQRLGIMQGRLVPPSEDRVQCFPRERWADEFALAADAGLDCIEWIFDLYGEDVNPLATDAGVQLIKGLAALHGVQVLSICADYFMDRPLLRAGGDEVEDRMQTLFRLLHRARLLGVNRVVMPFVDASGIHNETETATVIGLLRRALPVAEECGVELHLETALDPPEFERLLAALPHPKIRVNYDSGNSSSLGFKPRDEFAAYGGRIGSVHIKDRVRGGGTVPLGTGDADLPALFECLKKVNYQGDFILQAARGDANDELAWARQNRAIVDRHLKRVEVGQ
jgi:L-ribulose-5-phosphate 3-epimerase